MDRAIAQRPGVKEEIRPYPMSVLDHPHHLIRALVICFGMVSPCLSLQRGAYLDLLPAVFLPGSPGLIVES